MRDKLYVARITTPQGNVAHEVVALVPAEAVAAARQAREDAPWRERMRRHAEVAKREHAERQRRNRALWEAAEAWRLDIARGKTGRGAR